MNSALFTRRIAGLFLCGVGVVATSDLMHAATERLLPAMLHGVILFGPAAALLGLLLFGRTFTGAGQLLSRRNVLVTGLVMLGAGIVTGAIALATDPGGDASWANGMWFLMAGIFAGLPGLLLTLAALLLKKENPQ